MHNAEEVSKQNVYNARLKSSHPQAALKTVAVGFAQDIVPLSGKQRSIEVDQVSIVMVLQTQIGEAGVHQKSVLFAVMYSRALIELVVLLAVVDYKAKVSQAIRTVIGVVSKSGLNDTIDNLC